MKGPETPEHCYVVRGKDGRFVFHDDPENRRRTKKAAADLNEKSILPMKFLCRFGKKPEESLKAQCLRDIPNYMSRDFYCDGFDVSFSGYPHDEKPFYLTVLTVKSKKYAVYGIRTGDDLKESEKVLWGHGYLPVVEEDGDTDEIFEKDDVQVAFFADRQSPEKISKIQIRVVTFYLGNRIY